mmetsp:Transcript_163378/g.523828  ORF Transcript_163378/g.523828 Transcript_163378/m.523828 type:complete len:212 (-) Transcript_163378:1693-2328(-)
MANIRCQEHIETNTDPYRCSLEISLTTCIAQTISQNRSLSKVEFCELLRQGGQDFSSQDANLLETTPKPTACHTQQQTGQRCAIQCECTAANNTKAGSHLCKISDCFCFATSRGSDNGSTQIHKEGTEHCHEATFCQRCDHKLGTVAEQFVAIRHHAVETRQPKVCGSIEFLTFIPTETDLRLPLEVASIKNACLHEPKCEVLVLHRNHDQ